MKIWINNKEVIIPSTLREITLKKRIDFHETHGKLLEAMYESIMAMEDPDEKEIELALFRITSAIHALSFFSNIPIEILRDSDHLDKLLGYYNSSLALIFEEEKKLQDKPQTSFVWKEQEWFLHVPELKHGDKLTFGEFIDSKQIIQNMVNLGKNRWECLIPLAAIYLKKEGEIYEESFLYEGSDRLKLMEELPLDIALSVGFFLSSSLNSFTEVFQSFINPE